jgi:uncharacterized protein YkwD
MTRLAALVIVSACLAGCPAPTTPGAGPTYAGPAGGPGGGAAGGGAAGDPGGGASGGGAAGEPGAGAAMPAMAQALLAEHNAARAEHCAPPLTWSPKLAAVAQGWAEHLRDANCAFEHSGTEFGENLAAGSVGMLDAHAIVGMWVDERGQYDFAHGDFSMQTGHFTQVVWRGTTQVGCGSATCNGMDVWVCNYDPAGNVSGGYAENVLPTSCR